jgi:copper chaperone
MMSTPLILKIEGMHCAACVRRVTAALSQVPGVHVQQVEVGSAKLDFDPAQAAPEVIAAAVNKIGFNAIQEI